MRLRIHFTRINSFSRHLSMLTLAISLSAMATLPEAFADTIKVSLVEHGTMRNSTVGADDFEIGSTLTMKVTRITHEKTQLGSYSKEDGSMAGAYGDGEFTD
ncbi:MAG: hypothetical protein LJE85_14460 [Gammaproteobacteria bacterium]|nr:hypothetical protein [Gammaproteobacteria bacterium]